MKYFPISINLAHKKCLVIGGGKVSLRKTKQLLKYNADVTIISKTILEDFKTLNVNIILQEFKPSYLQDVFLVVSATNDIKLNQQILDICNSRNILCNSATNNLDNGYIFSAIAEQDSITVSVTTNGESPYISKLIKDDIQDEILSKYGKALEVSKEWRKYLLEHELDHNIREKIVKNLIEYTLLKGKPSVEKALQIIDEFR